MQSIANHYTMLLQGDRAKCEAAAAGKSIRSHRSTVAAAVHVDYHRNEFVVMGKKKPDMLSRKLFAQVQDQWALTHMGTYDQLRDRYRQEQRRKGARVSTANASQIHHGWEPARGPALTAEEKQWTSMSPRIHTFTRVKMQDKYVFKTMDSEVKNKTENSVVKEWFIDEHQQQTPAYGRIKMMFSHEAFTGGPVMHFINARWLDNIDVLGRTGLQRVQENPNNNFNQNSSLCLLSTIVPYNIALLRNDLQDPECDNFSVIDLVGRLGEHD
jgi:hypothetical protein